MSDLCMYEFEDIVWGEFCRSDDHMVPVSDFERPDDHSTLGDSHKKSRNEITNSVDLERKRSEFSIASKRRNTMLEKDSWSHESSDIFPSSSNSNLIDEASCLASEIATSANHIFISDNMDNKVSESGAASDTLLGEKTTMIDKSSFRYPNGDVSNAANDFDFFENTEEKGSSSFLYYGWPEIENFEDVDRMFRSCDETFGLGASKEDELGWFNTEESGAVMSSDLKFPYPAEIPMEKVAENDDSSKNGSIAAAATSIYNNGWASEKSGPVITDKQDEFIPKEQSNENKSQFKPHDQSLRKRKDHRYLKNGGLSRIDNLLNEVAQLPSNDTFDQAVSYVHSGNSHLSGLTSINPTVSSIKSETNDLTTSSPRDSSQASNQVQPVDSSHGPPFRVISAGIGNAEKPYNRHGSRTMQSSIDGLGMKGKQVYCYGDKVDHSDTEGVSIVVPGELGSANVLESSTMSSGVDHISLEAASFGQLQLVMEQLDLRTKLCIRDSLYRLARSAEQRHNQSNFHRDERDGSIGAFVDERTNNLMNIETDTNPIDRSVAHLLFHRPSESSSVPANAPITVRGPVPPTPVIVEKLVECQESACGLEKVSES